MPEGPSSGPGAIAGAFRSDKPDIRFATIDPARQARLGSIWGQYDVSADPKNNASYLAAYAANTPQAQKISQGNLGFLNQYATGAYDPTKSYADILGLNQKALGSFLMDPALNELTRQRKEQQARAGYGGQGGGTYDSLLQGRILQQLASQAVPNFLGYTTAAYGTAGRLGQENFQNRLGIIGSGEQYRQLDTQALRYLEPTRLARSDIQANLGNLNAIAMQEDKNRAYYRQPGLAERIGRGFNEVQRGTYNELSDVLTLAERAENLYAGAYSGKGTTVGTPGAAASQTGYGSSYGGGYGQGAGGVNQNQALNYFLQMYGNRGGGPGQSPYSDPTTDVPYDWSGARPVPQSGYPYPYQGDYFGG